MRALCIVISALLATTMASPPTHDTIGSLCLGNEVVYIL
jgi:hypothetical protein